MTDAPIDTDAPAPDETDTPPDPAGVANELQDENRRLWEKIEQLQSDQATAEQASGALADAAEENEQLRRKLGDLAVRESLRKAARAVGLADQVVDAHAHRFTCVVESDGRYRVEPNCTEFLLEQIKSDPLLARAASDAERTRRADTAIHTADASGADPAELLGVLDRDPAKKARFIARHGAAAFIALAARARKTR